MLGDRLKNLRTMNNLTKKQVSINLNLSETRYGQYENNRRNPDYQTLKEIANFYNVSIDYLLDNENKINKNMENDALEREALKNILIKYGYLDKNDKFTNEDIDQLMKYIVLNKDYIKGK